LLTAPFFIFSLVRAVQDQKSSSAALGSRPLLDSESCQVLCWVSPSFDNVLPVPQSRRVRVRVT